MIINKKLGSCWKKYLLNNSDIYTRDLKVGKMLTVKTFSNGGVKVRCVLTAIFEKYNIDIHIKKCFSHPIIPPLPCYTSHSHI